MKKETESKEVESVPVKSGEITTINGKKFPLAKTVKNQNGLKAAIIDLVLNLAAPDDDCMLSDFLHALQFVLDKHASQFKTNPIEVIKDRITELERIIGGDSEYDERSHSRLDEAKHILKLIQ